jgi:hypothetical protein
MDQQVFEFGAVVVGRGLVRKVPVMHTPSGDGVGHAVDKLAHGAFAPGGAQLAAEILLHDHVGRGLAPSARHLDIALLEHDFAAVADDAGRALFPDDSRVAIVAGPGEGSFDAHSGRRLAALAAIGACILGPRWTWDRHFKPIRPRASLASTILLVKHQHSSSATASRLQRRRAGIAVCILALTFSDPKSCKTTHCRACEFLASPGRRPGRLVSPFDSHVNKKHKM